MVDKSNEDSTQATAEDIKVRSPGQRMTEDFKADDVDADDPHKAEKLAKAGREDDPQEASE